MKWTSTVLRASVFAVLAWASTGCNVFEGLGDGSLSDDPAVLLTDGQRALERGQAETAVRLLARAVARTNLTTYEGRVARLKLSSALLLRHRLSLLLVQDVADDFVRALDRAAPVVRPDTLGPACTSQAPQLPFDTLEVTAVAGYSELRAARPVLDSVRVLMQQTLGGALFPASLAQTQAGLGSLVAQGADELLLAEVLANTAVVQAGIGYDALVAAGQRNQVRWVRVLDAATGTPVLGACAVSLASINTLLVEARTPLDLIQASADHARLRGGYFFEGSGAQMFAAGLAAFRDRLETGLGRSF